MTTTEPPPVELTPPTGHDAPPDFVWVGCSNCWTPKDPTRQMRAYPEWLSDGYRYLSWICTGCGQERFPALYGFWLEDGHVWREGGLAPPASEVKAWGS